MQPVITIFCAFTRRWAVDRWLENLAAVEHDPAQTNLAIIVDIDEPYILNTIKKFAEARGYRHLEWRMNSDWHPNEVRLRVRRQRVAEIKNQSKDLIIACDGDIIIGLEDDTVFDRLQSFEQLYGALLENDKIGFVEGVQMGRWGANIVGVWDADDFEFPQRVNTLLPPDDENTTDFPVQEITGGGFYGYATHRELYLNHEYHTATSEPWGPDVNYGFWLHMRGYDCLVRWDIVFGHNDHNNIGWPENERLVQVVYNKDKLTGRWNRTDNEQTRY